MMITYYNGPETEMTTKQALEIAQRRGWQLERRVSKGDKWIVMAFDESSQTQIDCKSNGFPTRREAIQNALARDFDPFNRAT